ncbi:biosynthetic-type acetolactate synthase large subunit [Acetonema longum]|uniref:Acetolactate synthase n=1 Tax=Acetonema longum DSM 6540 TaxID=1009370 RepID=F7NLI4_9FIRM|nr:biosynthetic-type acetolactate synthase large subunit [Acetonema longum]EGO63079.1 acetolactate synthase, large subunit [Acetonema longum DSM 6540]
MQMSGGKIIIECLLQNGVTTVFGYPGGATLPLYDALCGSPLRHILPVHEQGAVHAADGYARLSGQAGVCIATSGPGATNLVTGLATAYMDSSPVVAITGQVSTGLLGTDAFQEVDITGITMPVTKHNFLVKHIDDLADTIRQAFVIATSGRPGPVLVDVPRDIQAAQGRWEPVGRAKFLPEQPDPAGSQTISRIVEMLAAAKRPVMLAGGGIKTANAWREAVALAINSGVPTVSTLMGLGVFPSVQPYFLGLTGLHGHQAANWAVYEADVILAAGTRFNDRVTGDRQVYANGKTVIHLDVDPGELDKNITADLSLVGDLRGNLARLAAEMLKKPLAIVDWRDRIGAWQKQFEKNYDTGRLNAPWIMRQMSRWTEGLPVTWVTDVGQHQMWAAQHLDLSTPNSWISAGGMGTMGFGLPAALGAQAACPDRRVILVAGDGGFKMTGIELLTAAHEKLPIICVILNNKSLGMVRQMQTLFYNRQYQAVDLPDFDFIAFAEACSATGIKTSVPDQFQAAFQRALQDTGKPHIIVADIDPEDLVEMIYPDSAVNQFVPL